MIPGGSHYGQHVPKLRSADEVSCTVVDGSNISEETTASIVNVEGCLNKAAVGLC